MIARRPSDARFCFALIGPMAVGFGFAIAGPEWSFRLMLGVSGYLLAIMGSLVGLRSVGRQVPKLFAFATVLALYATPITSSYVVAWVITGSWIASTLVGATVGYLSVSFFGRAFRKHNDPSPAGVPDPPSERFLSAKSRPAVAKDRQTQESDVATRPRPRPPAKSR